MKIIIKTLIVLILFYPSFIICQNEFISNHLEIEKFCGGLLNMSMIFRYDEELILDRNFSGQDTIVTCLWNGIHWFRWKINAREWDEDRAVELFAFDFENKKVKQITNDNLYWENGYPGTTDGIFIYQNKMFVLSDSELIVVDNEKLRVLKRIKLFQHYGLKKIFVTNNSLNLVIQPYDRRRNYSYYLFFWLPKNKPSKWKYSEAGTQWEYVFDENINLIKKEKLTQ
jgi:hypothetical protein